MSKRRKTVSRYFRDLTRQHLPGLDKNPAYWELLSICLAVGPDDTEEGSRCPGIYVGANVLARIEGKKHLLEQKNYSGIKFLRAYQQDVAPIVWTSHDYREHRARCIIDRAIPEPVLIAYQRELQTPAHELENRVWLHTGRVFTPQTQREVRDEDYQMALERLDAVGCVQAGQLMEYLNDLPPARFTKMLDYMPQAYAGVASCNPRIRDRQLQILHAIEDQAKPFYAPSQQGRTVRLFSTNDSVARLTRKVRQALCQDWITVDLKSAQFAICAKIWDLPIAQEFLATGQSLWTHLFENLNVEMNEEHKAGLKKMVYGLIFGSGPAKNHAIERARKDFFPEYPDLTKRFFRVPLIAALYGARLAQQKKVERDGGAYDAFGNFVPLEYDDRNHPIARSVLACQAQSYELRLLWPVIEAARTSKQFDIMLYLFDGVCIAPRDKKRQGAIVRQLKTAVKSVANDLGIVTALECEQNL